MIDMRNDLIIRKFNTQIYSKSFKSEMNIDIEEHSATRTGIGDSNTHKHTYSADFNQQHHSTKPSIDVARFTKKKTKSNDASDSKEEATTDKRHSNPKYSNHSPSINSFKK
jgi:hypothetical protein